METGWLYHTLIYSIANNIVIILLGIFVLASVAPFSDSLPGIVVFAN